MSFLVKQLRLLSSFLKDELRNNLKIFILGQICWMKRLSFLLSLKIIEKITQMSIKTEKDN